jgi:hypothetical protein
VPPSAIQLLDETGAEILGSVGPFKEDTHLLLTCDILGGAYKQFLSIILAGKSAAELHHF